MSLALQTITVAKRGEGSRTTRWLPLDKFSKRMDATRWFATWARNVASESIWCATGAVVSSHGWTTEADSVDRTTNCWRDTEDWPKARKREPVFPIETAETVECETVNVSSIAR